MHSSSRSDSLSKPTPSGKPTGSLFSSPFFWAALTGMITLPLLRPLMRRVPKPPPVLSALPSFELIDQDGSAFGKKHMKGRVFVVGLFFTRCQSICLRLTYAMKRLQARILRRKVKIHLLSITVDTEYDKPEVLRRYAKKYKADLRRWTFLTGDASKVSKLVRKGFKTALGPKKKGPGNVMDITHSGKLILVDSNGQIRGYFSFDEMGRDEVFHRALHVLKQEGETTKKK